MLAKFTGSTWDTFKNALLLSVRHLPLTLLLTAIWATAWLLPAVSFSIRSMGAVPPLFCFAKS